MESNTQVPDGWEVVRLGDVARERNKRAKSTPRPEVFSVTKHAGFVRSLEYFDRQVFSRDTSNYKIVRRGDLAYATIHLDEGSLGILRDADTGLISPMYTVFEVNRARAEPEFLFSLMKLPQMVSLYQRIGEGSVHRRKSIRFESLGRLSFAMPPLVKQRHILAVLDSIDEAIERTEAVIAATERLRDALLHELLTRGVPGWHSEWKEVTGIGAIPACWEVVRLGDVCEVKGGKRLPKGSSFADRDTGLPYIRVVDFSDRTVDPSDIQYLDPDIQQTISRYAIGSNDVYISIAGTIGLVGLVPSYLDGANLTENAAKVVILNPKGLSKYFLMSFLDSYAGKSQISLRVNVLGQPKLALERIRTIALPIPSFLEQRAIAEALSRIDDAVERGRIEMNVLQTVKASATDALLTGRVRVRNHND